VAVWRWHSLVVVSDKTFATNGKVTYSLHFHSTLIINNRRTTPAYFGARAIMASDRSVERRIPRDAAVVINVLRSMGVEEWEPRVVNQLMEFVHRTSTPP